jgi:hypothetical protein
VSWNARTKGAHDTISRKAALGVYALFSGKAENPKIDKAGTTNTGYVAAHAAASCSPAGAEMMHWKCGVLFEANNKAENKAHLLVQVVIRFRSLVTYQKKWCRINVRLSIFSLVTRIV